VSGAPSALNPLDGYASGDLIDELRRRSRGLFAAWLPSPQPDNGSVNIAHRFHFVDGLAGTTLLAAVLIEQ